VELKLLDPPVIESWPIGLKVFIENLEAGNHLEDMEITEPDRYEFRAITSYIQIVGRHATKLLEAEIESIERKGLRFLSLKLITEKLQIAVECGALDKETAWDLLCGSKPIVEPNERREGLLFFATDDEYLTSAKSGLNNQLKIWGGEAISFTQAGIRHEEKLRSIGVSCVVEVSVDISLIEHDYELDWIIKQLKGELEGSPHKGGFSLAISENECVPVRRVYKY
jgi:hypothetical protein